MYTENKILLREKTSINGDINHKFRKINCSKMSVLLKLIFRFNIIPIKIPIGIFI